MRETLRVVILILALMLLSFTSPPQAAALICQDPPLCFVPMIEDGSLIVEACDKVTNPAFPLIGQTTQAGAPACPVLEGLPWPGDPLSPPEDETAICDDFPRLIGPAEHRVTCYPTLAQGSIDFGVGRAGPPCATRICDHQITYRLAAEGGTPGTWTIQGSAFLVKHLYVGSQNVVVSGSSRSLTCSYSPVLEDDVPGRGGWYGTCFVAGAPGTLQTDSYVVAGLYGVWDTKTWWSPAPGVNELVSQGRECRVLWGGGTGCVGF